MFRVGAKPRYGREAWHTHIIIFTQILIIVFEVWFVYFFGTECPNLRYCIYILAEKMY